MFSSLYKTAAFASGVFLPVCLFFTGIYLLIRVGKYVYRPRLVFRALTGNETGKGEGFSSLAALCLALAGTLGVGNITGVASAILTAGPGCIFWMWVCAAVSGILKYSEILLSVKYRKKGENGEYSGGPFRYIEKGLKSPALAVIFCLVCLVSSFTVGNMTQSRASADGLFYSFGLPYIVSGTVLFSIVLFLSLGGGKRISAFTLRLIPLLCLTYVAFSVYALVVCRQKIPEVTRLILSEAFTPEAGICGVLFSPVLRLGITRGIMSSEAGCGSAAIAYASAETDSPARQGFFGLFEVFCDTPLLCTLTAYVVLLSDAAPSGNATLFAVSCFSSFLGKGAGILLGISIFLFAAASIVSWSYYGQSALAYLGGGKGVNILYGIIFSAFAALGCLIPENGIWLLSDISISLMAAVNLPALLLLSPEIEAESRKFCRERRRKKQNDRTPKPKK